MEGSETMKEQRKSRNAAMALVALMLLSSQMYSLQNFEQDDPEESVWGPVAQRTAYQQMNQASGPVAGEGQAQTAAAFNYYQTPYSDPKYHDPAAIYGWVSDPSAPVSYTHLRANETPEHRVSPRMR